MMFCSVTSFTVRLIWGPSLIRFRLDTMVKLWWIWMTCCVGVGVDANEIVVEDGSDKSHEASEGVGEIALVEVVKDVA